MKLNSILIKFGNKIIAMKSNHIYHASPEIIKQQRFDEIKKMSPEQRFHKIMAIIEISYKLKTAKRYAIKDALNKLVASETPNFESK